jgi:hypothetical protein
VRLLTWGSLGRAFYKAYAADPLNANIQATVAQELHNICILRAKLPKDCAEFVRDYNNAWHFCLDVTCLRGGTVDRLVGVAGDLN